MRPLLVIFCFVLIACQEERPPGFYAKEGEFDNFKHVPVKNYPKCIDSIVKETILADNLDFKILSIDQDVYHSTTHQTIETDGEIASDTTFLDTANFRVSTIVKLAMINGNEETQYWEFEFDKNCIKTYDFKRDK